MQLPAWERAAEEWGVRVITALDRALAATARNSDYPTAPQHWSDTGNGQEAQNWLRSQDPDGSCCSAQQIPGFFFISGVGKPKPVSTLPPAPQHQRMGLENTTSNIRKLTLRLIWGLFIVAFLSCKCWLV